jgi:hypothetical protein
MKKLLLSFLTGLVILFSFAPYFSPVKAQSWYSQGPLEWYLKVYDTSASPPNEIFGERYTAAQVQWVIYSFLFTPIRLITNIPGGEEALTCIIKTGTGTIDINTCTAGAFNAIKTTFTDILEKIFPEGTTVASSDTANNKPFLARVFDTETRDISGIKYTKNLMNKFSLVSEVKAQGVGYSGLTWIQQYWRGFRNISYILIVLVVIVFSFMIMFRVKLNPQTVISVQSALPKVIAALILITFSYAIAGFAVDLMYIISGLFALLLKSAGFAGNINTAFETISGQGWAYNTPIGGLWILLEMLGYFVLFLFAAFFTIISSTLGFSNVFGVLIGVVFMLVAVWVLILAIWYTFKVPFVLIKTLISMYLTIITAPIQILAGTLVPSAGFGSWFKRLMADILVFPVTGFLFWFAWYTLFESFKQSGWDIGRFWGGMESQPVSWIPGIIGVSTYGSGAISGIIFLAISFGFIAMIPKVPDMLKGFLLGEKFSFGMAIGEATGPLKTGWGMTGAPLLKGVQESVSRDVTSDRVKGLVKALNKILPFKGKSVD